MEKYLTKQWYEYDAFVGNEGGRGEVLASSRKEARKLLASYGLYFVSLWPKGHVRTRNFDYKVFGKMTVVKAFSPHHWECVADNEGLLEYHYSKRNKRILLGAGMVLLCFLGWLFVKSLHWIPGIIFLVALLLTLTCILGSSFLIFDGQSKILSINGTWQKKIKVPFNDVKSINLKETIFFHSNYYSLYVTSLKLTNITIPISFSSSISKENEFAERISANIGVRIIIENGKNRDSHLLNGNQLEK